MEEARVIFTEHDYEVVANVASMCKQFESTEIGSGNTDTATVSVFRMWIITNMTVCFMFF